MLQWLLLTSALSISPGQTPGAPIDVSTLKIGAPAIVAELDLGTLKGELRQIGWSPDGAEFYVLTVDGKGQSERSRHYILPASGGEIQPVDAAPEWATDYWGVKSDRFAPGNGSLMIGFEQKAEKMKIGTGTGRPGEAVTPSPGGSSMGVDIEKTSEGQ